MAWNMEDLNPSQKFYHAEDKVEYLELRSVTTAKYKEFMKELDIVIKREIVYDKKGKSELLEKDMTYDQSLALVDLGNDYMIKSWNLVTDKGAAIEDTPENKKKMIEECPEFSTWFEKCRTELEGNKAKIDEESEKN